MNRLEGQRYGRLVVLRRVPGGAWMCKCDCGRICHPTTYNLKSGNSRSCGCATDEARTKHGMTGSSEYRSWKAMLSRCRRPKDISFHNYGGRGITVVPQWSNFEVFLRDMGRKPGPGFDLDRIDNEKGYSPENCRWVRRQKNLNNRRNNRVMEFDGRRQTIAEWAVEVGIHYRTLNYRINAGWPLARALLPVKPKG